MGWPAEVGIGALTDTSTTQQMDLGTVGVFKQSATLGHVILARYMENGQGASVGAGLAVGYADNGGRFDTTNIASTLGAAAYIAGVLPVSRTTGDFGWVVFRGPLTTGQWFAGASYASSAAERLLLVNASGQLITAATVAGASTDASYAQLGARIVALLRSGVSMTSGTSANGIIDVLWR